MKVLLIQSQANELQSIEESLRQTQYQVFNACTIKQALSHLAQQQFNLIICLSHLGSPLGKVSGLDFLKAIQKKISTLRALSYR